jgi:hypothetical protein
MASQQEDFYVWRPPQSERVVYLSLGVVDRILPDVLRGFGSLPKRGAEVGGLLLGRVSGSAVWIDAHEPVACGYAHGPSYEVRDKDEERFAQAVAQHSQHVVGFYRSDTREALKLAAEDLRLLDRHLASPDAVALLIRPYATKVSRAGFFFRSNGAFPSSTPLEFPFSRKLLRGESEAVETAEDAKREADPPPQVEEALPPRPPRTRRDVWAAALTLAVALGWSGGYFVARRTAPPPDPSVYALGLTVERTAAQFKVTWDGKSEALRTSVRGELRVEDQGRVKAVPLELDQLRMGEAIYDSISGRVRFELRVQQTVGSILSEVADFTRPAAGAP